MPTKVIMPQLGESVVEGTVSKWLKKVGDSVKEFEPLLEVSTDKVDSEVPAPAEGVILQIFVPEGTTVERGVLLAMIGQPDEVAPDARATDKETIVAAVGDNGGHNGQRYSPVVARMAAENNIDLTRIVGTGLGARVTKKDLEAYLATKTGMAEIPARELPSEEVFAKASGETASAKAGPQGSLPGELVPHSTMRRAIAEHMVRSKLQTAPHVTTVFEVDMTRVMDHWHANMDEYAKQGVKLTLTAYFVAALVKAVQAQPTLNARWTDAGLFVHHVVNVGMAVALSDGLIVPVIQNAQDLNLTGLARRVSDLASRARSKALRPDEVTGGTITLTNHGVSGSLLATPIINQPQSAIVGVGAVQKRVVVIDETDSIAIRPMMYATLTFDHRVADGAIGDAFMRVFKDTLEHWS